MADLGPVFTEIVGHVQEYEQALPKKISLMCGAIYFDGPNDLVKGEKIRISAGVLLRVRT